jgi:hypothetical protein
MRRPRRELARARHCPGDRRPPGQWLPVCGVSAVQAYPGQAQLLLIQVLLNAPELLIELVESLSLPLLSTMTIEIGLCPPIEDPLSDEPV